MAHVWLIGMMGSGKSTVGALLARELRLPFVDVDQAVVEIYDRSIEDLFAEGEMVFRSKEHDTIAEIAQGPSSVIATGGGAVLDPRNVAAMRATGTTVLLTTATEELTTRLQHAAGRPLLTSPGDVAAIAKARSQIYRESADVILDTTTMTIDEVTNEVVRCVGM